MYKLSAEDIANIKEHLSLVVTRLKELDAMLGWTEDQTKEYHKLRHEQQQLINVLIEEERIA